MMAAGQIGLMTNGGWLKGTLDASGVNYGIASLPTVTGEDQIQARAIQVKRYKDLPYRYNAHISPAD